MEIYENNPDHLDSFIALNEEWISSYFELEQADRDLAANPTGILDRDGFVFSITEDREVVGVCALFNEGAGVYELARMAVRPSHRGRGIGDRLMAVCLSKIKGIGAKTVYLVSNTKLEAAINLYCKHGFVTTESGQNPLYSRANIKMKLTGTSEEDSPDIIPRRSVDSR